MRILVVGAGATGGFYGGLLARAGRDVTFLLREGRARQIGERGLEIVTHLGEHLVVHPQTISAEQLRLHNPAYDLIVIATKSYQLEGAMEDIAPAVGKDTMLLPVLNGMRQLEILDTRFGADHVLGGTVRVVSDLDADGRVVQLTSLDELSYGERTGERTERIQQVDTAMHDAGFTAILQPDILATMWQKWWILASMGAICTLSRGDVGQVARAPHGSAFALAVLAESTAVARVNGYPPNPAMLEQHVHRFTDPASHLTSSLYRDMIKGAPVEADHILGDLLGCAGQVPVPLLTAAYVQLKVYEAARPTSSAGTEKPSAVA